MEAKKIAWIANSRIPTEKAHGYQICKMCESLGKAGHNVTLIHSHRRQPTHIMQETSAYAYYDLNNSFEIFTMANLDVIPLVNVLPRIAMSAVYLVQSLIWGLAAAVRAKRLGFELAITRDVAAALWLTIIGLSTVYEAHREPRRFQAWLLRQIRRKHSLRLVVALTKGIRNRFVELGVDPNRILVAYHAVEPRQFEDLQGRSQIRGQLGLPQDKQIVGYIGRFRTGGAAKGVPLLVEAMASPELAARSNTMLLCVGGPMDEVVSYNSYAQDLGISDSRLHFQDRVPNHEVPLWLAACDVLVLPLQQSYAHMIGALPLKLAEYMASGVPIVATDLPSIREVLHHGENAWLVAPSVSSLLAGGIAKVLDDDALSVHLASNAKALASGWTWDRRANRIVAAAFGQTSN